MYKDDDGMTNHSIDTVNSKSSSGFNNSKYFDLLRDNIELWDIFTSKEEYDANITDDHGRILYENCKNRDVLKPIISEFLTENGLKIKYPKNKKFAVFLSHDIDLVYSINSAYRVLKELKKRNIKNIAKSPFERFNKNANPLWNFKDIMSLEKKYGAKSTFYFMALDKKELGHNYNIKKLKKEIQDLDNNNWEIGLHGGFDAYNNLEKIKDEKKKLEEILNGDIVGYRGHYLKFKIPKTWEILHEAGFKYDSTFGFADMVGFRNCMCHPYKPFNLNTNKEIDVLEIPLNIMDTTLFEYMNLDFKGAWDIIKLLVDTVEKNNGVITILWHNTNMTDSMLDLYDNFLKYCRDKEAWMTCGKEIYDWYKKLEFEKDEYRR